MNKICIRNIICKSQVDYNFKYKLNHYTDKYKQGWVGFGGWTYVSRVLTTILLQKYENYMANLKIVGYEMV